MSLGARPKRNYHILLVEDNLINQKVLSKQLRSAGCTVHVANHGGEALDFLSKTMLWRDNQAKNDGETTNRPMDLSIILMDLEMPIMDGLAATRAIRDLEREGKVDHVPIIAVTANARMEQMSVATEAGMVCSLWVYLLVRANSNHRTTSFPNHFRYPNLCKRSITSFEPNSCNSHIPNRSSFVSFRFLQTLPGSVLLMKLADLLLSCCSFAWELRRHCNTHLLFGVSEENLESSVKIGVLGYRYWNGATGLVSNLMESLKQVTDVLFYHLFAILGSSGGCFWLKVLKTVMAPYFCKMNGRIICAFFCLKRSKSQLLYSDPYPSHRINHHLSV